MDTLSIYIKHRLKNYGLTSITDYRIYVYCVNMPSNQLHISVAHDMKKSEDELNVIFYDKYIRAEEKAIPISTYGEKEVILAELIKTIIKQNFNSDNDLEFQINVCPKDVHPNLSSSVMYVLKNKKFQDEDCPICKVSWNFKNAIVLPCKHTICNNCLFMILKNGSELCPVCRAPFV